MIPSPLNVFNIHDLPVAAHPGHHVALQGRLAELSTEAGAQQLIKSQRLSRLKVAAWLGNPEVYRDFLCHYQGQLLRPIYATPWSQLLWLPFGLGLMLSESFIDVRRDWFSLTTGPDGKTMAGLIRRVDFWRKVNPRATLWRHSPAMTRSGIECFGLAAILAYGQAEHRLLTTLLGFKFKPQQTELALGQKNQFQPTEESRPLVQRAVRDFFRLKINPG